MNTSRENHSYKLVLGLLAITILAVANMKLPSLRIVDLEKDGRNTAPQDDPEAESVPLNQSVMSGPETTINREGTTANEDSHLGYTPNPVVDPTQFAQESQKTLEFSRSQNTLLVNPFDEFLNVPNPQEALRPLADAFSQELSEEERREIESEFGRPINW